MFLTLLFCRATPVKLQAELQKENLVMESMTVIVQSLDCIQTAPGPCKHVLFKSMIWCIQVSPIPNQDLIFQEGFAKTC